MKKALVFVGILAGIFVMHAAAINVLAVIFKPSKPAPVKVSFIGPGF